MLIKNHADHQGERVPVEKRVRLRLLAEHESHPRRLAPLSRPAPRRAPVPVPTPGFAPMPGTGRVHGAHPGRVLRHSLVTTLLSRRTRSGELVTAAVAGVRRRRSGEGGDAAA